MVTLEEASRDYLHFQPQSNHPPPSPPLFGFFFLSLALHPFLCRSLVNPAEAERGHAGWPLSLSCVSGQDVLILEGQSQLPATESPGPKEKACVAGADLPSPTACVGGATRFTDYFT